MATVYLALDQTRDVRVALKAPKAELVMQLGAERFAREVQISTKLQHPHIVPVLDAGFAADGVPFYVMPFIDGETLEQRLERTGALPVDEAIQIACEVLDGLVYAHKLGFVHRDVKPSNVLLANGHALLADFGIARAVEHTDNRKLTESGFALGTAEYMSPEQAAGDTQLDGRSDIYSLACVLYEMLVGGPPFTAPTARAVMARHFVDPVPSIRTVRDTVPTKLELAVMTALAKTPVDRFADAAAFKAALRDPTLRDVTAATRPPRAVSLRRRMIATGVAVLALAAAATLWRAREGGDDTLDINRVMVYPFVLPDGFTGSRTVGEDVATIIGNALDAADPLKWIDGWSMLDTKGRENIRSLSHDGARRLARGKRCATFVTGRLATAGDSVKVSLTLYDVAGDSVLAQGTATGGTKDPWKQGLRAVSGILPRLIPGSTRDVSSEWRNRDPGAVANFLLGESDFRRLHLRDALDHYSKAISLDSTFAFAALRGAQAATWNHKSDVAAAMVAVALAQPLPPRYRSLAIGIAAYIGGHADSAAMHLRDAVAADSEMAVAWMQLGEVYTHLLPVAGNLDSLADNAFTYARRLDSTAASGLLHPIELRLKRGDTLAAEPLLRRYLAAGPDSILVGPLLIVNDCVRRGSKSIDWRALAGSAPLQLLAAAKSMAGAGAHIDCAEAAFDALLTVDTSATDDADNRRSAAMMGLQAVQLARDDVPAATASIDRFMTRWGYGDSFFVFDAPLVPAMLARAETVAKRDEAKFGAGYAAAPFGVRLWKLGVFAARFGRIDVASTAARDMHRRAANPDSSRLIPLAQSLDAFVLLARGDSTGAERALTSLLGAPARSEDLIWDEARPRGLERLTLAQLLDARGEHQAAINVATVFDTSWPLIHVQYLRASLTLRAAAAKALGNSAAEAHYLARLAAFRREAKATGG